MRSFLIFVLLIIATHLNLKAQNVILSEGNDSILLLRAQIIERIILKFPDKYDNSRKYPLIVALHGNGGTAIDMASAFVPYSQKNVIIAVPEGQYPKLVNGSVGYSWYYETPNKNIWSLTDNCTLEHLIDIVKEVKSIYNIEKIFVLGFSQGASVAYMAGFKYPELISGVIAVGGGLPEIDGKGSVISSKDIENAKDLWVIVAHGNRDRVNKKKSFSVQKEFLEKNGYQVLSFEYDGGHFLTNDFFDTVFNWIFEHQEKE